MKSAEGQLLTNGGKWTDPGWHDDHIKVIEMTGAKTDGSARD
jgi:hypothetical protein